MEYEQPIEQGNVIANAEAYRKYAKVVPINPAEIVDENGSLLDLSDTKVLRKWLLKKYQGHTVEVKDDGKTVGFYREGLKDSAKRRGYSQRQLYADLASLVENGVYAGYEKGDSKHPTVERQNIYYSAAKIGDKIYGVRFKVDIYKVMESGIGSYKDHKIVKLEIEKSLSLNNGNYSVQQNSDFSISLPKIRQAFNNKGNTFSSKSQELP